MTSFSGCTVTNLDDHGCERKGDLMGEAQTVTIQTDVPVRLLSEMHALVEAGWFRDVDELMLNALRRSSSPIAMR